MQEKEVKRKTIDTRENFRMEPGMPNKIFASGTTNTTVYEQCRRVHQNPLKPDYNCRRFPGGPEQRQAPRHAFPLELSGRAIQYVLFPLEQGHVERLRLAQLLKEDLSQVRNTSPQGLDGHRRSGIPHRAQAGQIVLTQVWVIQKPKDHCWYEEDVAHLFPRNRLKDQSLVEPAVYDNRGASRKSWDQWFHSSTGPLGCTAGRSG